LPDRQGYSDEKSFHNVAKGEMAYYAAIFEIKKEIPD